MPGDVSWFKNTSEGNRRGEEAVSEYERGSGRRWIFDDILDDAEKRGEGGG
jgi:hypothetical protein